MVRMAQSLSEFLARKYPDEYVLVSFGHEELLTDEIYKEYLEWVQTEEGKQYLKGGKYYK